jgi:hypothetical protein
VKQVLGRRMVRDELSSARIAGGLGRCQHQFLQNRATTAQAQEPSAEAGRTTRSGYFVARRANAPAASALRPRGLVRLPQLGRIPLVCDYGAGRCVHLSVQQCKCREIPPCRSADIGGLRSWSGMIAAVLVRFAYRAVSHAFAALWLLRMSDREKDVEILALRHQLAVLQRQLGGQRPRLRSEDRVLLAALLVPLARATLRRLRLLLKLEGDAAIVAGSLVPVVSQEDPTDG